METRRSGNVLPAAYRLGEYVIETVLGVGGFGITYRAVDTRLGARVAIKEYFPQAYATRESQSTIIPRTGKAAENYQWGLQEFLKEARALAKFKHNHIVRVLRFLEANGTAYMVMEYEEGESLAEYLRKTNGYLNEATLLQVFLPILSGLQAVHDAGLLHLDIKPDNIYLRSNGQPMLIDFGSSRQSKSHTAGEGKIALTPGYSAIEQYPNQGEKGAWTDVYSIGATLYKCITSKQPLDAWERFKTISKKLPDPLKPAQKYERPFYSDYIRFCIDAALELTSSKRPQSAYALQKGLMGQPMTDDNPKTETPNILRSGFKGVIKVAKQDTEAQKNNRVRVFFEKLFLRTLALAIVGVVTLFILISTEVVTYDQLAQVPDQALELYNTTDERVRKFLRIKKHQPVKTATLAPKPPVQKKRVIHRRVVPFDPDKTVSQTLNGHKARVDALALLLGDSVLASASIDGIVKLWDLKTGKSTGMFHGNQKGKSALAVSPDGRWLAIADNNTHIRLWDAKNKKNDGQLAGHNSSINQIVFSPDGEILASAADDNMVILWDLKKKEKIYRLEGFNDRVLSVDFAPNDRWLATGDASGEIRYWSITTGKELSYFKAHDKEIDVVAFSQDGKWLASAGPENFLELWGTGADIVRRPIKDAPETVHSLVYTPDRKLIIVGGNRTALELWDIETGTRLNRLKGHTDDVYAIVVSEDGQLLASGGNDKTIKIWR